MSIDDRDRLPARPNAAPALLLAVLRIPSWLRLSDAPAAQVDIPEDFLGVNVAPAEDAQTEAWIIDALQRLGTRQLRMDFTYDSVGGPAQRFLESLLQQGYEVMLDLFPSAEDARVLGSDSAARARWRGFLQQVLARYDGRVLRFEIGTTPNRGKWSGFSSKSIIDAWQIAAPHLADCRSELAGPNVSDFEPLYNSLYLRQLRSMDCVPAVHTDNLFVERVVEPEAFDHRVLGRAATHLVRFNLIKKARTLQWIGRRAGCWDFICTYTCWTSKRLHRRAAWPEQKQVDYTLRYIALAASSGAMRQLYWGPLICSRDGLIDDRATGYPKIDHVTWYQQVRGRREDFTIMPVFHALAFANRLFCGAQLQCLQHDPEGASLFALQRPDGARWLMAWCRDGQAISLEHLLGTDLPDTAEFFSGTGESMARPLVANEHPLFIRVAQVPAAMTPPRLPSTAVRHLSSPERQSVDIKGDGWIGACMLRAGTQAADLELARRLYPDALPALEETRVLRDVRNRLWNVSDPRQLCDQVTVKLNRVKGFKRFSYRFRPSKGRRHWNNACDMLRHGIRTPLPLAFYEAPEKPGVRDSWYLCEFIPDAFSSREVYAAFRDGADSYRGLDKDAWFDLLAGFVCNMHDKQIVHRDLSAGNLLLEQLASGEIRPYLIDIGRARVWTGPGSKVRPRHRLQDLIRICYKLNWQDRERFMQFYRRHHGASLGRWWRLPFRYYDSKQALKKGIKGKRSKRRR